MMLAVAIYQFLILLAGVVHDTGRAGADRWHSDNSSRLFQKGFPDVFGSAE
jgi:hypothetical protein